MSSAAYVLDVAWEDAAIKVLVNDWLCHRAPDGTMRGAQYKLNAFLLEGANHVAVRLAQNGPRPRCLVRLIKGIHDDKSTPLETLWTFRWAAADQPIDSEHETEVFRHAWTMTHAFGPWAWEKAEPYRNEDRAQVEALVREVRDAAERRDLGRYLAHFEVKNAELARSTERTGAELAAGHRRMMQEMFADPRLVVGGPEPATFELTSSAGGRLVEVATRDRLAPVCLLIDPLLMEVDMTVSKIDGQYRIVR
jgi:hypothetical protein